MIQFRCQHCGVKLATYVLLQKYLCNLLPPKILNQILQHMNLKIVVGQNFYIFQQLWN